MSKVRHVGERPLNPLVFGRMKDSNVFYKVETFADGTKRFWDAKTLNSGCGEESEKREGILDLWYCEYCDEWFAQKQFI